MGPLLNLFVQPADKTEEEQWEAFQHVETGAGGGTGGEVGGAAAPASKREIHVAREVGSPLDGAEMKVEFRGLEFALRAIVRHPSKELLSLVTAAAGETRAAVEDTGFADAT